MRGASAADFTRLLTASTVIYDTDAGHPVIVYLKLPADDQAAAIRRALPSIKFKKEVRTRGLDTRSRVFGYSPRIARRQDFCKATMLRNEQPGIHQVIAEYAGKVAGYYQQFHPELYAEHQGMCEKVLPDWKIKDSPFTSGIINQNNILPYHHDVGNFRNVWSNMLVFKQDVQGGYLSIPEYDIGLEVADNSLTMFDGQNLLHGVTPMEKQSARAFRYSIVYYSLQAMWRCLPPKEEVRRIQKLRTEREFKRQRPK